MLWYSCTQPYESKSADPRLASLAWSQRCPVPMAKPSLALLATLSVGDRSLLQAVPLPLCWPAQPHCADSRDLGVSEDRQSWVEIR